MQTSFNWNTKKVVVTGGSGLVGSHLVAALLERQADIVVIDNLITGSAANLDFGSQYLGKGQLTVITKDAVQAPQELLPADWKPDVVFHLASPASPPQYQRFPIATYLVNSYGTHLWLEFLHQQQPDARFIFASTSEAYGDPKQHPQKESYYGNVNPNGPRACYDESKRLGESICGVFQNNFGIANRIARIFNTYGPRMNPKDGRVIPNFVNQALSNELLTIYGDGSQTRSYCFVTDLVAGLLLLAEKDVSGETINLGNPDEMTILETAQKIVEQADSNSEIAVNFKPLPKNDPTRRQPDISKAQNLLGWQPAVSFEDGMAQTIEYFRQPNSLE